MEEIWKPVSGLEDQYEVSNMGRVRCKSRFINCISTAYGKRTCYTKYIPEHLLKIQNRQFGSVVQIYSKGIDKTIRIDKAVAEVFLDNPQNFNMVEHLDGNLHNNSVTNLKWISGVPSDLTVMWKPVLGYENEYEVSNFGDVRSKSRTLKYSKSCGGRCITQSKSVSDTILKQQENSGYMYVMLWKDGISSTKLVHRLVAEAFIPNDENKPQVDHIDCNKKNNKVSNLRWVTSEENMFYACKNGLLVRS